MGFQLVFLKGQAEVICILLKHGILSLVLGSLVIDGDTQLDPQVVDSPIQRQKHHHRCHLLEVG